MKAFQFSLRSVAFATIIFSLLCLLPWLIFLYLLLHSFAMVLMGGFATVRSKFYMPSKFDVLRGILHCCLYFATCFYAASHFYRAFRTQISGGCIRLAVNSSNIWGNIPSFRLLPSSASTWQNFPCYQREEMLNGEVAWNLDAPLWLFIGLSGFEFAVWLVNVVVHRIRDKTSQ